MDRVARGAAGELGAAKRLTTDLSARFGSLLVVGDRVYWATRGAIQSAPTTGEGPVTTLVRGPVAADALASDGEALYWLDRHSTGDVVEATGFVLRWGL